MTFSEDFEYLPEFTKLSQEDARDISWESFVVQMFGRTVPLPRMVQMFGQSYSYSQGVRHPGMPFPEWMESLREAVEVHTSRKFNSCLANLYRDGNDCVGWHSDDDYDHGGQDWIASISLGETRRFSIRSKASKESHTLELSHGSLLLMKTGAQQRWEHCLRRTKRVVKPRINLTFRYIQP